MFIFFFFKQKTAYEMRISDWSSDVCSSDLLTLLMAVIFRALLRQRPFITWGVSILVVLAAAGMFAVIDAWVFSTQNRTSDTAGVQLFLGAFYLNLTLLRSEEHTSELQSLMRISYAVFCLKKKNTIRHKSEKIDIEN